MENGYRKCKSRVCIDGGYRLRQIAAHEKWINTQLLLWLSAHGRELLCEASEAETSGECRSFLLCLPSSFYDNFFNSFKHKDTPKLYFEVAPPPRDLLPLLFTGFLSLSLSRWMEWVICCRRSTASRTNITAKNQRWEEHQKSFLSAPLRLHHRIRGRVAK